MHKLSLVWSAQSSADDGLKLLLNVIDALTLEPGFERFFARAADAIRELVGADGAALILLTSEQQCEYQFFHGAPVARLNGFAGYRFDPAHGVTGRALREKRSLFIQDYPAHPDAIPAFVEAGLKASLILPLHGSRGAIGALAMSWFRPEARTPEVRRLALAECIANQVAVACERHQLERQLAQLASRDALTELANRAHILESLETRLARAAQAAPFMVALVDLDGFKAINDEHGHAYGDRVLRDVGNRIRETCRRDDDVGRLGGDEFVVVGECRDPNRELDPLLQRITAALHIQIPGGRRRQCLSASIGVACYPAHGEDAETLLRRADLAMYGAKRDGGNRYRVFDRGMEDDLHARQRLLDEIPAALARGEFELHYQPVVNMTAVQVVAVEALLRWRHPEGRLRSAGEFIGVVEQYGKSLVCVLERWVLQTAAAQLSEWQRQGRKLALHVNVSASYFLERCFLQDLERILVSAPRIDPHGLVIELTETALVDDLDRAAEVMAACRSMGTRLALDDFGTGYASLTYFKRFPVDTVKIDRSFIRDLHDHPNDRAIVRGILAMAHALNLSVIAEGVETDAQVTELLSLGCGQMQGFGFAPPLPRADLETWLAANDGANTGLFHRPSPTLTATET